MDFLIILAAPFLLSLTNLIDKYLVEHYAKKANVGSLMIFSTGIGLLVMPLILLWEPGAMRLEGVSVLIMIFSGMLYVLSILPYLKALSLDDVSIVMPMFQMVMPIGYFLGLIFLKEQLTLLQLGASLMIFLGSVGISLNLTKKNWKFRTETFFWVILSSLLFATSSVFFKYFSLEFKSYWVVFFWENVGFIILALIFFFFIKKYREDFLHILKDSGTKVVGLNLINEGIAVLAKLSFNYASLLVPLTVAVMAMGLQPLFIFIESVFITLLFPKLIQENLAKKVLVQKLVCTLVILGGVYLLTKK